MTTSTRFIITLSLLVSFTVAAFADSVVVQSARQVPVAYEVDLLVVGGSTGGVAAACEAARAGATVLLVTPYPYLGEDRTATLRLAGENGEDANDPLARVLANDNNRDNNSSSPFITQIKNAVKHQFTYKLIGNIDPSHPEIPARARLTDTVLGDPVTDSLQVNGDAEIVADCGQAKEIRQIVFAAYRRTSGEKLFETERVELSVSNNGNDWTKVEQKFIAESVKQQSNDGQLVPFTLTFEKPLTTRYLKLAVRKKEAVSRQLFAELVILPQPLGSVVVDDKGLKLPRPMHVKHVLDNSLLESNVQFLFNTFVTGDVEDANGTRFGAVIANRSGRQAIVAKRILDTRPQVTSLKTAKFVVIGAAPQTPNLEKFSLLKNVTSEVVGKPFVASQRKLADGSSSNEYPVVEYTFAIDVPDNAAPTNLDLREKIENQIRLATYSDDQSFTADEVYFEQKFEPLPVWRKRGQQLAAETKTIKFPKLESLVVTSDMKGKTNTANKIVGDVREVLSGLRRDVLGFEKPITENGKIPTVSDPARSLPVLGKYDVVVVGGGTSGAPAGIAAARQGAKTLVLEHLHDLGGIGTAGAISIYWYGNVTGFTKEVQNGQRNWGIESKTYWWRSKLAEAGADVWYGVLAHGALVINGDNGDKVNGVLVATPFGAGIVEAGVVIDATGNGDIAIAAGSAIHSYDNKEIAVQGAGLAPRNLGASYTNTDFMFVDDADIIDSSHVFVYAKEKYPSAFDQAKLLGTRERRQVRGEFSFTVLDQVNKRTYPDSIVYAYSDYDTHGYTIDPYMELNHPYRVEKKSDGSSDRTDRLYAYVPYRSCVPKGLNGIFVVGLAISSHRDALPIVRMQPDLQNQGYAIGCAAAMITKENISDVRKLNVRELQKHLVEIGNLSADVLKQDDNYGNSRDKLPQAVAALPDNFHENAPLVMWYPDEARPLVHRAYIKETDFERKFIFAKVAAGLNDNVGVPTLIEKLKSYKTWDNGWRFKAMGQAGSATSPMDQLVMTLGRTKDSQAADVIIEKSKMLTSGSEFSHIRAVAVALENIGGEKSAKALNELLDKDGMTGYVHDTIEKAKRFDESGGLSNLNQEKARRDSLVEISLARALYRTGDVNKRGETILKSYTKDLRGYYSRHARAVLNDVR
ncbi:MAG: FAD-dependent oxidoreductase [Planctomycetaceae bacterium]|jgi:hypothetical protein|nr:FAD-dependent oxidoreductase [Planctomycetaceae bacterium]